VIMTRVYVIGAIAALAIMAPFQVQSHRTNVSGRNVNLCDVWLRKRLSVEIEKCLSSNELYPAYDRSLDATVISGREDSLDPSPVRTGVGACLGADVGSALKEGSNRDAGGNMLFGKIDCGFKYINYVKRRLQ